MFLVGFEHFERFFREEVAELTKVVDSDKEKLSKKEEQNSILNKERNYDDDDDDEDRVLIFFSPTSCSFR